LRIDAKTGGAETMFLSESFLHLNGIEICEINPLKSFEKCQCLTVLQKIILFSK
jgi:hypothetical protein